MSTAAKGKRAESRLADELCELGWTAERVPRSVADATPLQDVVAVPPGVECADHEHRPVTRAFANELVPLAAIDRIEVKATKGGAYGIRGLYATHLETVGLGTQDVVEWVDGYVTGGVLAWTCWQANGGATTHRHTVDDTLAKQAAGLVDGVVDAAAVRVASRSESKPFVMIWEVAG